MISRCVSTFIAAASMFGFSLFVSQPASAEEPAAAVPSFEVYGFAQVDYIQDFDRVNPDWEDTLRPSRIPTEEGAFGSDGQASVSAKQSRLGVNANLPVADESVKAKIEFDFFGVGDDAGQFTIRPRHLYGEWRQILGGQTNSLFMDGDIFPNVIDYWGPTGMVFLRTPQIRWTPLSGRHSFAIALEKPGNDIDEGNIREFDPALGENITNDEELPDFTAQYRFKGEDWGHVQLAGILRQIGFDSPGAPGNEPEGDDTGWGIDLTSVINLPCKNYIRLGAVIGEGIASYMNDGGTDLAPERDPGDLDPAAVPLWGISAYYDHSWSDKWTSSIGYSRTQVDNTSFQSADAYYAGDYASVNALYTPVKNVLFGAEVLWGKREDNDGESGEDVRSQITAKYSFSSADIWPTSTKS